MPKSYWIAQVDVHDPAGYEGYRAANAEAFRKYGARFVVRGGAAEQVEGRGRSRVVVIEFADRDTALACYRSPEYARAMALRLPHSTADIVIVDGYDGPQPSD